MMGAHSPESHQSEAFNFKKKAPENTKSLKPLKTKPDEKEEPVRDLESEVRHRVKKKVW
jgi:hypothetical protein